MSERRFVIREMYSLWQESMCITEAELKSRCEIVTSILAGHSPGIRGWNEALGILLHGDRKEGDHE